MRSLIILVLLATTALLIPGCGEDPQSGPGNNTFYYNESDGLNTLDPAKISARAPWWIGEMIYIGLVGLDSSLQPVPRLAKSWSVNNDGITWTFNLRSDAYFADDKCFPDGKGRQVTAEDVRYSFERVCDPATGAKGLFVFLGKVAGAEEFFNSRNDSGKSPLQHVSGLRVVDDTTFQIELVSPFPPFLSMLSIPFCYVVPHEAVEMYREDFFRNPVGAGPFRLVNWAPDQLLTLVRNERYYERDAQGNKLPYLDSVSVSFIRDVNTAFLKFEQGSLDMLSSIDPGFADKVLNGDGKSLTEEFGEHHLYTTPAMSVEYYGFMLDPAMPGSANSLFLDNVHLRRAINYAIDRDAIITYVLQGRALSAKHGPIPPGTPGFSGVQGYTYNRQMAARQLDSAGYPGGKGLPPIVLQLGINQKTASVGEAVQEQLKAIGVTMELKQVDFPQHLSMVRSGRLPFWRTSWIGDYPDAENFMSLFYSNYASPVGPNTTHYSNQVVDSLYRTALNQSLTLQERAAVYGQAERIILDDAPWVFLYYNIVQRITQPWITGYTVDPLDRLSLTYVRKK